MLEGRDFIAASGPLSAAPLEYSSTNNEYPFFFLPYPLDNLVCSLCKRIPRSIGARHTVEFEIGRNPGKGNAISCHTMKNFEVIMSSMC